MPIIHLPTPIRKLACGSSEVQAQGETLGQALDALESQHPGICQRIVDSHGRLQRHVRIFRNGDDISNGQDWRNASLVERDSVFMIMAWPVADGPRPSPSRELARVLRAARGEVEITS